MSEPRVTWAMRAYTYIIHTYVESVYYECHSCIRHPPIHVMLIVTMTIYDHMDQHASRGRERIHQCALCGFALKHRLQPRPPLRDQLILAGCDVCMYVRICMNIRTYVHACVCACVHMCMCAYVHVYMPFRHPGGVRICYVADDHYDSYTCILSYSYS
jgi:hypothetical protein